MRSSHKVTIQVLPIPQGFGLLVCVDGKPKSIVTGYGHRLSGFVHRRASSEARGYARQLFQSGEGRAEVRYLGYQGAV